MQNGQNYIFKTITLKTAHLSEQYHFYTEQLGFECISKNPERFEIKCGKSHLIFEDWNENCKYHFAFNIPENQVLDSANWIRKYADIIAFEDKEIVDFPNWNAHSVYFKDPAGNILEFIARHNLENQSNKKFDAQSILEISEIGIPVENISNMYNELKDQLNFELYWGDMEKFAAIGHEKCLFITVPLNRPWFPSEDVLSKKWPIELEISKGESVKTLRKVNSDYLFFK